MNNESRWRVEHARHMAAVFSEEEGVCAVVLSGAVAAGQADIYSETHLRVIWSALPAPSQQQRILDALGGVSLYGVEPLEEGVPAEGYAPFLLPDVVSPTLGGPGYWLSNVPEDRHAAYPVEWENESLQSVERSLEEALVQHRPNRAIFDLLGELQSGTVLCGEALVDGWRQRLACYPDALRANVVEQAVAELWQQMRYARVLAERGDHIEYVRAATVIAHCLLRILFAVNGLFGWQETPKRSRTSLARMAIAPDACYERLCRALVPPLREGVEGLNALAHETVALASEQVGDLQARLARYLRDEPRSWSA